MFLGFTNLVTLLNYVLFNCKLKAQKLKKLEQFVEVKRLLNVSSLDKGIHLTQVKK